MIFHSLKAYLDFLDECYREFKELEEEYLSELENNCPNIKRDFDIDELDTKYAFEVFRKIEDNDFAGYTPEEIDSFEKIINDYDIRL